MYFLIFKSKKIHFYFFLVLILLGSSIPGNNMPRALELTSDKILHFIEYFILGWLSYRAYHSKFKNPVLFLTLFGIMFGCLDEFWQSFIPGRYPSHYDVFADGIGVICGIITSLYIYKNSV